MGRARAVLIGGGITGVLTARELLLAGWDVELLEGAHVGAGSSSRTAAGIRQQFSTPDSVRGMRYAVSFYKEFAAETEQGQCPIQQNGYLFLYDNDGAFSAAERRVAMQHQAGLVEAEALNATALQDRFPWTSDELVGATWCPTDGFLLPHLVYNDGARRVRELGGTIRVGTTVTGARHAGGRLLAVDTNRGPVEGDLFVDCTNAWTARTGALLAAAPLEVAPLKRYLWFLQRGGVMPAEVLSGLPLTIGPTGVYCRPENRETLMVGKKHTAKPDTAFSYDDQDQIEPVFSHRTGVDAVPYELWMELAEAIPATGEFDGITATTCGYYGTTPDHNPFLGYDPRVPNLIRLVGFSGHGAMFGPFSAAVGRSLAEAGSDLDSVVLDGEQVSLAAFRIGRSYEASETMVI
jgi:glycine/D-amino acid oxidase-like deaminating enzyme